MFVARRLRSVLLMTTDASATPGLSAVLRRQRPLAVMVAAMLLLSLVCALGMLTDSRQLLGVSVWLKPFKFAVAFALYGASLAWLLSFPHRGSTWTSRMAAAFSLAGIVDVGFIAVQAARGTYSHFNTSKDAVNQIGQIVFMSGVPGLFVANLVIASILVRQRIADRPVTRAIHAGLALAVVAMALGYTMGFQGAQIVRNADGSIVELGARHTVGATDSDRGMPITDWSTVGGDLRIPHFVGLHAIQVLIVVALALAALSHRVDWLRGQRVQARLAGVVAVVYAGFLALTAWQAYRGQPLMHPDGPTLSAAAVLVVVGISGVLLVRWSAHRSRSASFALASNSSHSADNSAGSAPSASAVATSSAAQRAAKDRSARSTAS